MKTIKCNNINLLLNICSLTGQQCQYATKPTECPNNTGEVTRKRVGKAEVAKTVQQISDDHIATDAEIAEADINGRLNIDTEKTEGIAEWLQRTGVEFKQITEVEPEVTTPYIRPTPTISCPKCGQVNWRIKSGLFGNIPEVLLNYHDDGTCSYFFTSRNGYASGWVCASCEPYQVNETIPIKLINHKITILTSNNDIPEEF